MTTIYDSFFSGNWIDIPSCDGIGPITWETAQHIHSLDSQGSHQHTINQLPTHQHTFDDGKSNVAEGTDFHATDPAGDVTPTEQSAGSHSHTVSASSSLNSWQTVSGHELEHITCSTNNKLLLFKLPISSYFRIEKLRVKHANQGAGDHLSILLVRRDESNSILTWATLYSFDPPIDDKCHVSEQVITPVVTEPNYSYAIIVVATVESNFNDLYSVGAFVIPGRLA